MKYSLLIRLKKIISFFRQTKISMPSFKRQNSAPFDAKSKKITVIGGYGYGNTGDEAQLAETLKVLGSNFPDYQIKVLTPNPDYTFKEHGCNCDFAPRVLFFNNGLKGDCYNFDLSPINKTKFIFISVLIWLNAHLVKRNFPFVFLNSKRVKMLEEIKSSSMLYFCGGGYLTGKTLSRLWDGILIVLIAKIFNVPVVMSGQTIGVWNGKFNQFLAKLAFKHVDLITVRDVRDSLGDLGKIGVKGENVFYTHDDALFCEKASGSRLFEQKYAALNFHYWGIKDKSLLLAKINKIVDLIIEKTGLDIVFTPLQFTDEEAFFDYIKLYPNPKVHFFKYQYGFREVKKVIADSEFCTTMKHHPIIFAIGENVPVVSLAFSDYYIHKNKGALELFNQERFCVDLENEGYFEIFKNRLDEIINSKDKIKNEISTAKAQLTERKNKFIEKVREILA